jgi:ribosomal protein S3
MLGVKVMIVPPEAKFPDQVQILEEASEERAEEAESETTEAEE